MHDKKLFLPILKNGKYGFVDSENNLVIKPKFKYVSERFREGYCVITYIKRIRKSIRWVFGYIDEYGKNNIFIHLDSASDFSEGLSRIKFEGRYGYIDKNLSEVIETKYESASNFSEGMAGIKINKRWGYIDKNGNTIIKPS